LDCSTIQQRRATAVAVTGGVSAPTFYNNVTPEVSSLKREHLRGRP